MQTHPPQKGNSHGTGRGLPSLRARAALSVWRVQEIGMMPKESSGFYPRGQILAPP